MHLSLQECIFKSKIEKFPSVFLSVRVFFQDLRMEIAKQELIVHARETASKVLKAINGKLQWCFMCFLVGLLM